MTDHLYELSALLKKHNENHKKLLALENQKTGVLLKGDINELNGLMNAQMPLMMDCANTEKQREKLQKEMGLEDATLAEITEKYASCDEFSLGSLLEELSQTVNELKKINGLNMAILDTRLKTIRYMGAAMGIIPQTVTYQRPPRCETQENVSVGVSL